MEYLRIFQPLVRYTSALGIFFNTALCWIIWKWSGKEISSYKYYLFGYAFFANLLSLSIFLLLPVVIGVPGGTAVIATIPWLQGVPGDIFILSYCANSMLILSVLVMSFMYRYLALCRPEKLYLLAEKRYAVLIFLLLSSPNIIVQAMAPSYAYTEEAKNSIKDVVEDITGFNATDLSYAVATSKAINMNKIIMYPCIVMFLLFPGIIIFSAVSIVRYLSGERLEALSPNTKLLHRKFFKLLILQTISPIVFDSLPLFIASVVGTFGIVVEYYPQVLFSTFLPLPAVIDPILIVFYVTDYNRRLLQICGFLKKPTAVASLDTSSNLAR